MRDHFIDVKTLVNLQAPILGFLTARADDSTACVRDGLIAHSTQCSRFIYQKLKINGYLEAGLLAIDNDVAPRPIADDGGAAPRQR
jgi:hypothetical protein